MTKTSKATKKSKTDERIKTSLDKVMSAFQNGTIPSALAQIFITSGGDRPCDKWSYNNRLLALLESDGVSMDARTYRQWQKAGRQVVKGQKSFAIYAPMMVKVGEDEETGDAKFLPLGFKPVPVFALGQTEGEEVLTGATAFLENLPLRSVAESWGIKVSAYDIKDKPSAAGWTNGTSKIGLGTFSKQTWAHELIHCADGRSQKLQGGQCADQEIVAELGAAVLLTAIGMDVDADLGRAHDYIRSYLPKGDQAAFRVSSRLIDRTCKAVQAVLDEAERIADPALAA